MRRGYVGWSPTITGRVSFSRVGENLTRKRVICNRSARDNGWVFELEERTSRDGPFPPLIMRLLGEITDILYLIDVAVVPGRLPMDQPQGPPIFHNDDRGALRGRVVFFTKGKWARSKSIRSHFRDLRVLASRAKDPHLDVVEQDGLRARASALIDTLWKLAEGAHGDDAPGYGRANVELTRNGRCRIEVADGDLLLTPKARRLIRGREHQAEVAGDEFESLSYATGRQVFFFLKDLTHQHYHHNAHADLLVTPHPESKGDGHWRRETQYALARLVIARRREGTALAFREALGIMAYAEAFQKHFCGWEQVWSGAEARASDPTFFYDFSALKASLDSSLKVREFKDGANRQTALFLFAFLFTTASLIIGARRLLPLEVVISTPILQAAIEWTARNTPLTLGLGLMGAFAFDLAFVRQSVMRLPMSSLVGGLARASDGLMATALRRSLGWTLLPTWLRAWIAYAIGWLLVSIVVATFVGISFLGWFLAMSNLSPPGG